MIEIVGRPFSRTGLGLQLLQFVCSVASFYIMSTAKDYVEFKCFVVLISAMIFLAIWSFSMACLDACGVWKQRTLDGSTTPALFFIAATGDWVAWLAATAGVGTCWAIVMFYMRDHHFCAAAYPCTMYLMSTVFAGIAWISLTFSANVMLWIIVKYHMSSD